MAQTRTYDPSEGDDLAKLVRDALGENMRPTPPGSPREEPGEDDDGDDGDTSLTDLPVISF